MSDDAPTPKPDLVQALRHRVRCSVDDCDAATVDLEAELKALGPFIRRLNLAVTKIASELELSPDARAVYTMMMLNNLRIGRGRRPYPVTKMLSGSEAELVRQLLPRDRPWPKRRGRKPLGLKAMTGAERMRRHRGRRR